MGKVARRNIITTCNTTKGKQNETSRWGGNGGGVWCWCWDCIREEGHLTNPNMIIRAIMGQGATTANTNVDMHTDREHT